MMRKRNKIGLFIISMCFILGAFAAYFWAQADACDEDRFNFNEPFDTTNYKDEGNTSARWIGDGEVTLSNLGANFDITEPKGMGARIYVCDAGDFDGDGKPDLIGLDLGPEEGEFGYPDPDAPKLRLVRNHYEDADMDGNDDDGLVFWVDPLEIYDTALNCGPASITVADYNDDGLLDFFFYKNADDDFSYTDFVAAMYINTGSATDPDFQPHYASPSLDFRTRFMDEGIYANWAGDHLASSDVDGDGDIDVLVISEDKIFLVRNPGASNFDLSSFEIAELNYDFRTGFNIGRGGSSVDAADLDNDGDIDILGGTVNDIPYLVYYENDGNENFTRRTIDIPVAECTGTVATCVADFNHDGFVDIFAGTDRWNAENEARAWFQRGQGIVDDQLSFEFRCLFNCQPILPDPHDVDVSAMLDYDLDGDLDVILADANHSGDYYLIVNELAPVYALHGEAWSLNLTDSLDPHTQAVTRVRLVTLDQGVRGGSAAGLAIEIWVSNNNGRNWEFYARFGEEGTLPSTGPLQNYTDLPWHSFNNFGSRLKWKAILTATEDEMEEYQGASYETPVLDRIRLEYAVVERREYARTSVAASVVDDAGQDVKLIIGGSFYFPGWQGQLRAYDVSDMGSTNSSYSELQTVTRPDLSSPTGREIVADGVTIHWDAGLILAGRSAASREIYTVLPDGSGGFTRYEFTTANVGVLGPELQDFQNRHADLIEFVRGEGREWKLGDINHSNPAILGAPDGIASQMGSGYETFMEDWEDRPKCLIVGANDGMLHCFDLLTGEELWAFIPYNLVSKLKNLWAVDPISNERYFARDVYVDGSPVVADVYIDGSWKTVLVCGQGPGKGLTQGADATGNYYFALDITDIEDPQFLWEFTDSSMGETWSVPVIGRITNDGVETWAAFMGSGFDNVAGLGSQGHRFYAVDIEAGDDFWYFNADPEINTSTGDPDGVVWSNATNVARSIPGSPSGVDIDNDGYLDRIYVGDMEGRMWKVDVGIEYQSSDPWDAEVIYQDSMNYPILTKPATHLDIQTVGSLPRVYFGTGGHDNAPDNAAYSFIALIDDPDAADQNDRVEWFMGDPIVLGIPAEKHAGDLSDGEKVWADPKVANTIVYFSTLTGSIETVDPCASLSGVGRLYGRFTKAVAGAPVGGTAFRSASGNLENLGLEIKTRAAVTLGESERIGGVRKREVYIQEYDSTIQKLEQPVGAELKIKSWREIYKIKR
jgi:hypothetical protein